MAFKRHLDKSRQGRNSSTDILKNYKNKIVNDLLSWVIDLDSREGDIHPSAQEVYDAFIRKLEKELKI